MIVTGERDGTGRGGRFKLLVKFFFRRISCKSYYLLNLVTIVEKVAGPDCLLGDGYPEIRLA